MRRKGVVVAIAALLVVAGCGVPRARVHGTVKYQGQPLAGAVITFFSPDNATFTARTHSDGTYQVDGIPRGTVRVSVQIPGQGPELRPPQKIFKKKSDPKSQQKGNRIDEPTSSPIKLPSRYGNPDTSDLSFELKEPDQDYSIDLK